MPGQHTVCSSKLYHVNPLFIFGNPRGGTSVQNFIITIAASLKAPIFLQEKNMSINWFIVAGPFTHFFFFFWCTLRSVWNSGTFGVLLFYLFKYLSFVLKVFPSVYCCITVFLSQFLLLNSFSQLSFCPGPFAPLKVASSKTRLLCVSKLSLWM